MTDYRALLRELAVPRLVGSVSHARVVDTLKRELAQRGFSITEQRFKASPASLAVVGYGGTLLALVGLSGVVFPLVGEPAVAARVLVVLGGLFLLWAVTPQRRELLSHMGMRDTGATNLVATRGSSPVAVWLVAHYDAKGQPISMATRLYAVALAGIGGAALVALAAGHFAGAGFSARTWIFASLPAVVGGGLLIGNTWFRDSPGAVDNASGIIAALAVIDRLPSDAAVGLILPDAEEFGLVGAKTLVRERSELFRDTAVVNFDGIDDRGGTIAFVHRPGPVVDAVVAALGARRFRVLPVVVDGLVLARAARECVTILKGNWDTARIVHTPRDTAERLTLEGVAEVARGVAGALRDR
ncbi:MAG: M28 family peptidase [Gemmatimonadales bacterium]